jgi:hypothetical protein
MITGTIPWGQVSGYPSYRLSNDTIPFDQISGAPTFITSISGTSMVPGLLLTASGTSVTLTGTATNPDYVTSSGTVSMISGTLPFSQVSGVPSYFLASGTLPFSQISGVPAFITGSGTALTISGTISASQVSNITVTGSSVAPGLTITGSGTNIALSGTAINPSYVTSSGTVAMISGTIPASQVSGISVRFVKETPNGSINGTNRIFTLSNTPTAGSDLVFVNGVLQDVGSGNDYQISGSTVTFESGNAPQSGDKIIVSYLY